MKKNMSQSRVIATLVLGSVTDGCPVIHISFTIIKHGGVCDPWVTVVLGVILGTVASL